MFLEWLKQNFLVIFPFTELIAEKLNYSIQLFDFWEPDNEVFSSTGWSFTWTQETTYKRKSKLLGFRS